MFTIHNLPKCVLFIERKVQRRSETGERIETSVAGIISNEKVSQLRVQKNKKKQKNKKTKKQKQKKTKKQKNEKTKKQKTKQNKKKKTKKQKQTKTKKKSPNVLNFHSHKR